MQLKKVLSDEITLPDDIYYTLVITYYMLYVIY